MGGESSTRTNKVSPPKLALGPLHAADLHPATAGAQATFLSKEAFKLYQTSVYHFKSMCRNGVIDT